MEKILPLDHFFLEQGNNLENILLPLKRFGIYHYTYMANYTNGGQVYLSNNSRWIEDYYNLGLYRTSLFEFSPDKYETSHFIWNSDIPSDVILHGRQCYNSDNGITIINKSEDLCEFYFFSTSVDNLKIFNFYINNLDILYSFIQHFKTRAKNILKIASKNRIYIPNHYNQNLMNVDEIQHINSIDRSGYFKDINKKIRKK